MKMLANAQLFEVLCLQLADEGREQILLGDCLARVRSSLAPFMVGDCLPSTYLEFPLMGDPFLDVTVLYSELPANVTIDSPAAEGTKDILAWYAEAKKDRESISFGFELDTKEVPLPRAAVHFQPRTHTELVRPFCEVLGEPERADLYLSLAKRMPQGWPLSFFGLFRGRPGSPLRVCGYLDPREVDACASDPQRLVQAFDTIGFGAHDQKTLSQISAIMAAAPSTIDFQFDVWPDGSLGPIFAIDVQFGIEQPKLVRASFEHGPASNVFGLFEEWGAADERWRLSAGATFARALPVELDDGSTGRLALTLMPQWTKARWIDGVLQPAKLYFLANSSVTQEEN